MQAFRAHDSFKTAHGASILYPEPLKGEAIDGGHEMEMDEDFDLFDIGFFNVNLAIMRLSLASIHASEGKIDAAIEEYTQVLEFDPSIYLCYVNRGRLFGYKGEREKAKEDFSRAIKLEPQVAITYIYRGDIYYDEGNYVSARDDYRKALELNPESKEAWGRLQRLKRKAEGS